MLTILLNEGLIDCIYLERSTRYLYYIVDSRQNSVLGSTFPVRHRCAQIGVIQFRQLLFVSSGKFPVNRQQQIIPVTTTSNGSLTHYPPVKSMPCEWTYYRAKKSSISKAILSHRKKVYLAGTRLVHMGLSCSQY